eukprot:5307919-Alexandrium_andersonii.AAC.1
MCIRDSASLAHYLRIVQTRISRARACACLDVLRAPSAHMLALVETQFARRRLRVPCQQHSGD